MGSWAVVSGLGQLLSLPIANSSSVVMTMVNGDDEYYNGDNENGDIVKCDENVESPTLRVII